jgi:pimeloyl-ACP methyl ester carboxylesterase
VWALDFLGYATSDRYPQMQQPADATTPLGRSEVTEIQVTSAVNFIRQRERVPSIDIVAHSWGTVTAGRFAAKHPDEVRRLVLFAPINSRPVPYPSTPGATLPAWRYVDAAFQFGRFDAEVPGGQPQAFPKKVFDIFY